jgi:3'-phosphoadenosine 5'-phosphosulfate sulfotransferase (PAPS reductase)/FAD synthetase
MFNIVSLSGGKDSTFMLHEMVRRGVHIDEIVNVDTTIEFDGMHKHLEKMQEQFDITILKPEHDFEYYMFEHKIKTSTRAGQKGFGWSNPNYIWCRRFLKLAVITEYLDKKYGKKNYQSFIGIAFDEYDRYDFDALKMNKVYPLIDWKITELMSLRGCYKLGYDWDGLYDIFFRVSCWCCPLQSIKDLYMLYSFYPDKWFKLLEYDSRQNARFRKDYTLEQLNEKFKNLSKWDELTSKVSS